MKIINNTLSENLLQDIQKDIAIKVNSFKWASSTMFWEKNLKEGISGSCLSSPIEGKINDNIIKEITPHVPKCDNIVTQYYVWQHNAGISVHNDQNKVFGATIYLNREWYWNDGGIFLYKPKEVPQEHYEWNAIKPEHNLMIVNDEGEDHMVTPVSVYSHDIRFSIQIWGMS